MAHSDVDITISLDFSVYQCRCQPNHGSLSNNGYTLNSPTPSICNDNYDACLTTYDINDTDEEYGNDHTTYASHNGHINYNGTSPHISNDYNPSLPPCINQICTLIDFFPSPIPLHPTMTPHYTKGNPTQQEHDDGNKHNNATHGNNGISNKNGYKTRSHTHCTSTACNINEIPSTCHPNEITACSLQPIL